MNDATEPAAFEKLAETIDPRAGVGPLATTGLDLPLWTQNGSYGAVLDRLLLSYLWSPGVPAMNHLSVTQRGAGANLSVDVYTGVVLVAGSDTTNQGAYLCRSTAINNLIINGPPPAGQTRIDRIVARVYDSAIIGGSTNGWSLEVVQGTPSSTPSAPAVPASSYSLAQVSVPAGLASVTNANITDERKPWIPMSGVWNSYPIVWSTASGGTAPVLGNGTLLGRYAMFGPKLCAMSFFLGAGSTTTFGTAEFEFTWPFTAATNTSRAIGNCGTYLGANNSYWHSGILRDQDTNRFRLFLPNLPTSTQLLATRNSDNTNTAGTGYPQYSGKFTYTAGTAQVFGSAVYEIA